MAIRPRTPVLTGTSVDVLNAIRNSASTNYREFVPVATPDADVIKGIGSVLMELPELRNEFLTNLVNRIAKVIITSKMYSNPWAFFKKGLLEYGESVEEIFVNIARAELYDPALEGETVWRRRIPDVRAAFHVRNYEVKYPITIQDADIKKAFLTLEGVNDLITKIYESLYTAAEYDEFIVMKYMVARHLLDGHIYAYPVPAPTDEQAIKGDVVAFRATSNLLEYMSGDYNLAGVKTHTRKADQYIIINAEYEAKLDVNVLAAAFHMDKAEYLGHRVGVDSFGALDNARLEMLFRDDPTYRPISDDEKALLDEIPAVLVDREWFQIYDNLMDTESIRNPSEKYTNVFYHTWKTFSISPFANAVVFPTEAGTTTAVTITPANPSAVPGSTVNFGVTTDGTGIMDRSVNWSISGNNSANTTIDNSGNLRIGSDETASSITVTATLAADETVTGSTTVILGSSSAHYPIMITNNSPVGAAEPMRAMLNTFETVEFANNGGNINALFEAGTEVTFDVWYNANVIISDAELTGLINAGAQITRYDQYTSVKFTFVMPAAPVLNCSYTQYD